MLKLFDDIEYKKHIIHESLINYMTINDMCFLETVTASIQCKTPRMVTTYHNRIKYALTTRPTTKNPFVILTPNLFNFCESISF